MPSLKELESFDPNDRTVFQMRPDRYYAAMWFVPLPVVPECQNLAMGGDVNSLLWRQEATPEDWVLQWRFRYYRSKEAFESGDRKVWYNVDIKGKTEPDILAFCDQMYGGLADAAGTKMERILIQGDHNKFRDIVTGPNCPKFLHMQGIVQE